MLIELSGICKHKSVEQVVRASSPRGFLDLNMDALAAGYALAKTPAVAAAS